MQREDTSTMVNQATTSHETFNTGLPPNWETNYDDDKPPPLVQYENDSSDDESNDEDDLQLEELKQHSQIYRVLQQKLGVLQQKVNVITSTKMNCAYMQQTTNEITVVRQQVDRFNYEKLPFQ